MGKIGKEENSDGIEIISIGKLYTGPWDKKYWSSSRGKDRYPYTVGYKSLRTQNGVAYTMEILEGQKGPSFMVSSCGGKSCTGDTPDIAWDRFQKKGFSKLWHGKRFSCKIDGVEFFGFKNMLVQRLLRELVADVGLTAEQSLHPLNIANGAYDNVHQLASKASNPDSDMLNSLAKSCVTEERSQKQKVVNSKQLNTTHSRQQPQEKCAKNGNASKFKQKAQSICGSGDTPVLGAGNEVSEFNDIPVGPVQENLVAIVEDEKHLQENKELTSSSNNFGLIVENLTEKKEPTDRSRDIQECINLTVQERRGVTSIEHSITTVCDVDLCVPDTLDHAWGSSSGSSPKNQMQVDLNVKATVANDVSIPQSLATDSAPDDKIISSGSNTNSGKCATDSFDQEFANSMMTVLLPRALPLLKTFTRKKKKSEKSTKTLSRMSQMEKNISDSTMTDAAKGRVVALHSDLERNNDNLGISCANLEVSASGNSGPVVPDSFDNDDLQDLFTQLDAAKITQGSYIPDHCAPLLTNINAEPNPLRCGSQTRKHDTRFCHNERTSSTKKSRKDSGADVMLEDTIDNVLAPVGEITNSKSATCGGLNFPDIHIPEREFTDCDGSSSNIKIPSTSSCSTIENKAKDDSGSQVKQNVKLNSKLSCIPEFFASYIHPMPISMVQIISKDNKIFVCVKCGYLGQKESILFVYCVVKDGENMSPSLIGHVPIDLQISTTTLGRDDTVERSLLQLTPGAQSIVLLNSIKTPYCREGKFHCSCPACTSDCFEKNAVKIVKLNSGYASLVTRLETAQAVCCLLVCEPSFLLTAEEDGKLKLWVMNFGWSGQVENCFLPTFDWMYPAIIELKRIPNSTSLIVGHNGFGEFGLWDINKHDRVTRFSAPDTSVLECFPVSMFRWQRQGDCNVKALMDEVMNATKAWNSGRNSNHMLSADKTDVAVWLLISTPTDPDYHCCQTCRQEARCWRLALLVNNIGILGSAMCGGAAAVTSVGHGIIGRCDGSISAWELSTGMKIETLYSVKGSRVSCISTNSGALAVACGDELQLYLSS